MRTMSVAVGLGVLLACTAADAGAQTDVDTRARILHGANVGDRITVTLRDGAMMRGRLVDANDALLVEHNSDRRTIPFADIDRVAKRKNGILLGALIGTAAGIAIGLPVRSYLNNEARDGDQAFWVFVISGAAIGTGLDALMASDRTIYRRPNSTQPAFAIAPTRGGVAARLTLRLGRTR